jgi:hypothetical protein
MKVLKCMGTDNFDPEADEAGPGRQLRLCWRSSPLPQSLFLGASGFINRTPPRQQALEIESLVRDPVHSRDRREAEASNIASNSCSPASPSYYPKPTPNSRPPGLKFSMMARPFYVRKLVASLLLLSVLGSNAQTQVSDTTTDLKALVDGVGAGTSHVFSLGAGTFSCGGISIDVAKNITFVGQGSCLPAMLCSHVCLCPFTRWCGGGGKQAQDESHLTRGLPPRPLAPTLQELPQL